MHLFDENVANEVIIWRRQIHQYPELAFKEVRTTAFIKEKLSEFGVDEIIEPDTTGLIAIIRGEKKSEYPHCIAFRADMDCLPSQEMSGYEFSSTIPGSAHTCGHDIHTSILLGLGKLLQENRKYFSGVVKLLFQPAEEIFGGSLSLIKAGALKNPVPEGIVALHVWPEFPIGSVAFRHGPMMAASDTFKAEISGSQGHGAHPHKCVDPVMISGHVLVAIQSIVAREIAPIESGVISIGMINGGLAENIIPEKVVLAGTIRSMKPEIRKTLHESLKRVIIKTAECYRGKANVTIVQGPPALFCDEAMLHMLEISAAKALGKENVYQVNSPSMGGEDFAFYLEEIPGVFFRLGIRDENDPRSFAAVHSPNFFAPEKSFITGLKVLFQFAMDQLSRN